MGMVRRVLISVRVSIFSAKHVGFPARKLLWRRGGCLVFLLLSTTRSLRSLSLSVGS